MNDLSESQIEAAIQSAAADIASRLEVLEHYTGRTVTGVQLTTEETTMLRDTQRTFTRVLYVTLAPAPGTRIAT